MSAAASRTDITANSMHSVSHTPAAGALLRADQPLRIPEGSFGRISLRGGKHAAYDSIETTGIISCAVLTLVDPGVELFMVHVTNTNYPNLLLPKIGQHKYPEAHLAYTTYEVEGRGQRERNIGIIRAFLRDSRIASKVTDIQLREPHRVAPVYGHSAGEQDDEVRADGGPFILNYAKEASIGVTIAGQAYTPRQTSLVGLIPGLVGLATFNDFVDMNRYYELATNSTAQFEAVPDYY